MIVETYLEDYNIEEVAIDLNTFRGKLEEYIKSNDIKSVRVSTSSLVKDGVSLLLQNSFSIDEFKIGEFNGCLSLTLEEGRSVVTISKDANVCLDLLNSKIVLNDFGTYISFIK